MEVESKPEWMPINQNRTEPGWKDSEYTIKISRIKHREFEDGCQQTARNIFVWLNSDCVESHSDGFNRTRKDCKFCMQQFCKEVRL